MGWPLAPSQSPKPQWLPKSAPKAPQGGFGVSGYLLPLEAPKCALVRGLQLLARFQSGFKDSLRVGYVLPI